MDIKEIAKEMTRKEFLNKLNFERDGYGVNGGKILNMFITCPCDINLEDTCYPGGYCGECWKQAIKDIKFKGEDEVQELTFKEVIANIKEGEKWICTNSNWNIKSIVKDNEGICINYQIKELQFVRINNEAKFIKEQQPVTFEEVLNANKKCRVEHELLENVKNDLEIEYFKWIENYSELSKIMFAISNSGQINEEEYKEIIKNGKWYIEE